MLTQAIHPRKRQKKLPRADGFGGKDQRLLPVENLKICSRVFSRAC